jgi:hypothetical protein
MSRFLSIVLGLAASGGVALAAVPSDEDVARWVRQLGDEDFQMREQAARALIEAGPRAVPAVRAAARSTDAEVRRRALRIAEEIQERSVKALQALGAFVRPEEWSGPRVVRFPADRPNRLTDADLVHLTALPDLEDLSLENTQVTDTGLALVGRLGGLKRLDLSRTRVTDAGLAPLQGLASLESLSLNETSLKGPGLAQLKTLKRLEDISLVHSRVTDVGLAEGLAGLGEGKSIRMLWLGETQVGDEGLARLKSLRSLTALDLSGTHVSNAGLLHLGALPELYWLDLRGTAITDKGLAHLARMKGLAGLCLFNTAITAEGLAKLKGLPNLKRICICGKGQLSLAEALDLLAQPAPPNFAVVEEIDKDAGTLLYREKFSSLHSEEVVKDGPGGRQKVPFMRPVVETVTVRFSVQDWPVFDGEGNKLAPAAAWKRLAVGTTVLVSTDGKKLHPSYLQTVRKDILILVPPVPGQP